ncbi:hypothetical protein [Tateyamaria sp. SN3-11]|uniref:hypothetical protein n=1 Tax=Tateyamaria sp. SN3-11 TaxID=3092147 RepID=UPI0039E9BF09
MRPKNTPLRRTPLALGLAIATLPVAAHAYVGPGAGLTAIGTMVALFAVLVLALVGFVWYPIKRWMGAAKTPPEPSQSPEPPK